MKKSELKSIIKEVISEVKYSTVFLKGNVEYDNYDDEEEVKDYIDNLKNENISSADYEHEGDVLVITIQTNKKFAPQLIKIFNEKFNIDLNIE